jgi:hypothetical protein
MAYMSQEKKKSKQPAIKAILKKYNVKGTLAVDNHSTLVLNIQSGVIDFIQNYNEQGMSDYCNRRFELANGYIQVNEYHYNDHFTGIAKQFLREVIDAMMEGNHNNSDSMSDYYDIGWYISVRIGQWNKPYQFIK